MKSFFRKQFLKKFQNVFRPQKICENVFLNFFEKNFQKKHFVSKKRKMFFFQKNKVLVYRGKKIFFLQKKIVFKNGVFWFCPTDTIGKRTPPHTHTNGNKEFEN